MVGRLWPIMSRMHDYLSTNKNQIINLPRVGKSGSFMINNGLSNAEFQNSFAHLLRDTRGKITRKIFQAFKKSERN